MRRLLYEMRRSLAAPSRHPRMAVVVGRLLGGAFVICFGTGLYSHFLQEPLPWMAFPTSPPWLYQLTQGIHVTTGIACFPLLLGKLYTVYPRLFSYPPITGFVSLVERASIAVFVAASLVEISTGLVNTFRWYPWPFPFRQVHFALAFVIIGSLAIHIGFKLPVITRYWTRARSLDADGQLRPPAPDEHDAEREVVTPAGAGVSTVATAPRDAVVPAQDLPIAGITGRIFDWIDSAPSAQPRIARRGFLITVGLGVASVVALTAGQSFSVLGPLNVFAPRKKGQGPGGLPVNRSAVAARITPEAVGADWRLVLRKGDVEVRLRYDDLLSMPQRSEVLPIACVEGWSQTAQWRGVRLNELMQLVGWKPGEGLRLHSLEVKGGYRETAMGPEYAADPRTLVALRLDGEVLDIDHGYPARMIAPGRPGVLQTKWLGMLEVEA